MADQRKTRGERAERPSNGAQSRPFEALRRLLSHGRQRPDFEITEDHIRSLLLARRARDAILGEELFSDPGWDVLLELYAARLSGRETSVSELASAIRTPPSIVARWVDTLSKHGLTTAPPERSNSASAVVSLTDEGLSKLEHLAKRWGAAFVSI